MLRRFYGLSQLTRMGKSSKGGGNKPEKTSAGTSAAEEQAISVNSKGQIVLRIHAKPGAKLSSVTDVGAAEIGVAIAAPPRDGQANQELIDYVGKLLGLRKSELDFDKGAKSRSKILLITTDRMKLEDVETKLRDAAAS